MMEARRYVFGFNDRIAVFEGGFHLFYISGFICQSQVLFVGLSRIPWKNFSRLRFNRIPGHHNVWEHLILDD